MKPRIIDAATAARLRPRGRRKAANANPIPPPEAKRAKFEAARQKALARAARVELKRIEAESKRRIDM